MTAKDEIAEYLPRTRFGKEKKPLKRDKPIARPFTRGEAISQIEEIYGYQKWKKTEEAANSRDVGLEPKALGDYTNEELKIILDDAERRGMILYAEENL